MRLAGRSGAPGPIVFLIAAATLWGPGHASDLSGDAFGPVSKSCAAPEFRRFDFWVGDWDAFDFADPVKPVARARVDVILEGCALREIYEQADGLVGQSFTTYDASRKLWHQTWVTNRGELLQIEGRFQGDSLTLEGPRLSANGHKETLRGVWTPQAADVRETAQTSTDGGKTWKPLFDVVFRRRKEVPAVPPIEDKDSTATETLRRLNQQYVDAYMNADAGWYRDNLAEDFVCIESDGSVVGREEFLRDAARGPSVAAYTLVDVRIRLFGNAALVHATGSFTRRDGSTGTSRYTDVYVLMDGKWKAVSAQITRAPGATRSAP